MKVGQRTERLAHRWSLAWTLKRVGEAIHELRCWKRTPQGRGNGSMELKREI